jgi:SAM-dependent methyltransferase
MFENYPLSIQDPHLGRLHSFAFDTATNYPETFRVATQQWVRFVSTYARYVAPRLLARHDFSAYRQLLDFGGNNGELAIQLCWSYPDLRVTIFDIPVVCDIGTERVAGSGLGDRINFVSGDARVDTLPSGFDAVVFSSVLCDHETEIVNLFLQKAYASLKRGADIVIWEPYKFDIEHDGYSEADMDLFPFAPTLGPPDRYVDLLPAAGFEMLRTSTDDEVRFLYTTAKRLT